MEIPPKDIIKEDSITIYLSLKLYKLSSFNPIVISNILFINNLLMLNLLIIMVEIIKKQVSVPHISRMVSIE